MTKYHTVEVHHSVEVYRIAIEAISDIGWILADALNADMATLEALPQRLKQATESLAALRAAVNAAARLHDHRTPLRT